MRPKSRTLTALELEIMKIVWQLKSATVHDVYESLLERRRIAYTTVMTIMKILEQKQYLKRRLEERAYVYQATRSSKQVIKGMVREFVNRVFDGSARPLLAHLVEDRSLSAEELAGDRTPDEGRGMNPPLWLDNVVAYGIQIAIVVGSGTALPVAFRLRSPGAVSCSLTGRACCSPALFCRWSSPGTRHLRLCLEPHR